MATLDKTELKAAVDAGLVSVEKHPTEDLYIYNYKREAVREADNPWASDLLRKCRGIILDGEGNIVARPFEKFFNLEEFANLPEDIIPPGTLELPYIITEKIDGSLGIMYWTKDGPALATRSTFVSDQAIRGTKILRDKYWFKVKDLPRDKTFLFEIIYPENKMVVNYGNMEDVILIGVIDTETGKDESLDDYPEFLQPCQYVGDWRTIREHYNSLSLSKEGFVVCFENGFRIKIKFPHYFQAHYLIGKLTRKNILKILAKGPETSKKELADMRKELEVDEELVAYFDKLVADQHEAFNWYVKTVKELARFPEQFDSMSDWSAYVRRQGRFAPAIFLFCRLDGRPEYYVTDAMRRRDEWNFNAAIWRMLIEEPRGDN